MKYYLQVVGLPGCLTSSSLVLFFDSKRYIFNTGEGIQRLCVEFGIKFSKITDLFLTGIDQDILCSPASFMLSTKVKGSERRRIHGPPGLGSYMAGACSSFLHNHNYEVIEYNNYDCHEGLLKITITHTYQDENITVDMIPLFTNESNSLSSNSGLSLMTPDKSGIIYIVKCKRAPPTFRPDLAKALGIPPGPLYAKLKNGESVEVNGRLIAPSEVTQQVSKQPIFAVIHIPSSSLLNDAMFTQFQNYLTGEFD